MSSELFLVTHRLTLQSMVSTHDPQAAQPLIASWIDKAVRKIQSQPPQQQGAPLAEAPLSGAAPLLARALLAMDQEWARRLRAEEEPRVPAPFSLSNSSGIDDGEISGGFTTAAPAAPAVAADVNASVGGRGALSGAGWLPRVETHACRYLWECDERMEPRVSYHTTSPHDHPLILLSFASHYSYPFSRP